LPLGKGLDQKGYERTKKKLPFQKGGAATVCDEQGRRGEEKRGCRENKRQVPGVHWFDSAEGDGG